MHHPLAVAVEAQPTRARPEPDWTCRTQLHDPRAYRYQPRPATFTARDSPLEETDVTALACGWLRRRGVEVHCTTFGLLHPDSKRLWISDIVGERKNRAVLAVTYYSRRRRSSTRGRMREYASGLHDVCQSVYKLRSAETALINVYGAGRVEGEFVTPA